MNLCENNFPFNIYLFNSAVETLEKGSEHVHNEQ